MLALAVVCSFLAVAVPPAPSRCVKLHWGSWSACDASCGGGTHKRLRLVGGNPTCPKVKVEHQVRVCNTRVACSGRRSSTLEETNVRKAIGRKWLRRQDERRKQVLLLLQPLQTANSSEGPPRDACSSTAQVWPWGTWSSCSVTCGIGESSRARARAAHCSSTTATNSIPSLMNETQPCVRAACPARPMCVLRVWGRWSACAASCGHHSAASVQRRFRSVRKRTGGASCAPRVATRQCGTANCPRDCDLSQWGAWSPCLRDWQKPWSAGGAPPPKLVCGRNAKQVRQRFIVTDAKFGGRACFSDFGVAVNDTMFTGSSRSNHSGTAAAVAELIGRRPSHLQQVRKFHA